MRSLRAPAIPGAGECLDDVVFAEEVTHRPRRRAAPFLACRNISHDARLGRDLNPLPEPQMPRDRGLAADRDEILERRRAGDADLRHDHAMLADGDVMGDLDEVIDLRPRPDQRVAAAAAVDRRVRADLDIVADDHAPELRHLEVALRPHHVAEAILADAHAGVEDDAVAEHRVADGDLRGDGAVAADADTRPDDAVGADARPRPDLGPGPDDRARIDDDPLSEPRRRMDEGVRRHAALAEARLRPRRVRIEPGHDLGVGAVRRPAQEGDRAGRDTG